MSALRTVRRTAALPLIAVLRRAQRQEAVGRDLRRRVQPRLDLPLPGAVTDAELVEAALDPAFRGVLYTRMRDMGTAWDVLRVALSKLYPPEPAMTIGCPDIGPGLLFMHGFSTIVLAERIGRDCQFAQQVTVGYSDAGGPPVIGDRVRIGAGAIVIGPVTVGDDAVVGAGAVVVKDVPPGAVVGGVPARLLAGATDRFGAR